VQGVNLLRVYRRYRAVRSRLENPA
jgi:hypothetical protein